MALPVEAAPSHYALAQVYSDKKLLEIPRVNVPPPDLTYHTGNPTFHVDVVPFNQRSEQYGTPDFLRALVSTHHLDLTHSILTWQYPMRRSAQSILPFVFLGPSSVARDLAFINNTGITLLVAVRTGKSVRTQASFLDPAKFASSAGRATLTFDFDHPAEFISRVKPVIRAINNHLESTCIQTEMGHIDEMKGRVLIFCESGNDRSALLAAAYLMVVYGVDAISAIHVVSSQRFCITLSDEMKNILLDLQAITSAERQVSDTNAAMGVPVLPSDENESFPFRPGKRNIDDFDDCDDEIRGENERVVSTGLRGGVAPFKDAHE